MLGTPGSGSFGQARAFSSDSNDDSDAGFGFQSLGSLFPPPPAPGRYSQPRERKAEDAAAAAAVEKRTPKETRVPKEETWVPKEEDAAALAAVEKRAPKETWVPKEEKRVPKEKLAEEKPGSTAFEKWSPMEHSPKLVKPKTPFFQYDPPSSDGPELVRAPEQAREPTREPTRENGDRIPQDENGDDLVRKVERSYDWSPGRWAVFVSGERDAKKARLAKAAAANGSSDRMDSKPKAGPQTRRERGTSNLAPKSRANKAINAGRKTPNPFATRVSKVVPSAKAVAQEQPSADAWGLAKEDQEDTSSIAEPQTVPNPKVKPQEAPAKATSTVVGETPAETGAGLTHVKPTGEAHMVDVGDKASTKRIAIACAYVQVNQEVAKQIEENNNKKGDVLGTARIAGIMAAKRTSDIIPLCHPLAISKAEVDVYLVGDGMVSFAWRHRDQKRVVAIQARVECVGPTGVEMEAMMAVQGAALTVVDMCKALDKGLVINNAKVVYKAGGRSGHIVDLNWLRSVGFDKFEETKELKDGIDDFLVRGWPDLRKKAAKSA